MKVKLLFEFDNAFKRNLLDSNPFFDGNAFLNSKTRATKKNIAEAIEMQLQMWLNDEGKLRVTVIE